MNNKVLHIGTCSWKYDSWEGLVYSQKKPANYLAEYSKKYSTVEVDQWFWSLFAGNKVVLPKASVVKEYAESVPEDFTFAVKVPNAVTLTHHYKPKKSDPLQPNPYFLSVELMERFLESLSPLTGNLGPIIFQFGYLNKQMMTGISQFLDSLAQFTEKLPANYTYCVEIRNPNYLGKRYFDFLQGHQLYHVFLQGYYMPSIFDIYKRFKEMIRDVAVIRLHGGDRKEIEGKTGKEWNRVVEPRNEDISNLVTMIQDLESRDSRPYIYVNNHFEGSAPRTISRISDSLYC